MTKCIAILGSTGSIGRQTLEVVRHLSPHVRVCALAARENIDLLEQQAREFHPSLIAVFDEEKGRLLQQRLPHQQIAVGREGLNAVAAYKEAEIVISAIAGTRGLEPTVTALSAGKTIGLANKEALVSGGNLVMRLAQEQGGSIIPIDSEHSAIFQCLQGSKREEVQRLILTSSGGPFRTRTMEELDQITPEQALKHPTWAMGPKVTIDSSTLMNKGLEVIEAYWLFQLSERQIDVVIHPQSIVHSFVEYCDGSLLAQLGVPTMLTPIQYALTYPQRLPGLLKPFDFVAHPLLEFSLPDLNRFPCLALAYHAIQEGGSMPCYMNAANEVLVGHFLERRIRWTTIARSLERLMARHQVRSVDTLEEIMAVDQEARDEAESFTHGTSL